MPQSICLTLSSRGPAMEIDLLGNQNTSTSSKASDSSGWVTDTVAHQSDAAWLMKCSILVLMQIRILNDTYLHMWYRCACICVY